MLQRGDCVPHFTVTTWDGDCVAYGGHWQRRNLVLVCAPNVGAVERSFASELVAAIAGSGSGDTACVFTSDPVPGAPSRGLVMADKWGEVIWIAESTTVAMLPSPDDVVEWLQYTRMQCPECQGEAR